MGWFFASLPSLVYVLSFLVITGKTECERMIRQDTKYKDSHKNIWLASNFIQNLLQEMFRLNRFEIQDDAWVRMHVIDTEKQAHLQNEKVFHKFKQDTKSIREKLLHDMEVAEQRLQKEEYEKARQEKHQCEQEEKEYWEGLSDHEKEEVSRKKKRQEMEEYRADLEAQGYNSEEIEDMVRTSYF